MAGPDRQAPDPLIAELSRKPYSYDFFAAGRLLQRHFRGKPRIGRSLSPAHDSVRFGQSPSLEFAPAALEAIQQKEPGQPPVVYSRHFGLFGPNGPLPLCMTEYARERILHHGDKTFAAFCNVFHHRLFSFFFRAWADTRKTVDFDRRDDQRWSYYIGALDGFGMDSVLRRDSIPDGAKLYYSGRLANQTRNAEGLQAIIHDFFGIKTEVQTFVGCWMNLPPDAACKLGESRRTGVLGSTAIAGARIWTCQMRFRLRMGPMKHSDFKRLLPDRQAFQRLQDWVRTYCGEHYLWDAQLVLSKDEVPATQLGCGSQLGWTTWLKTKPFEHDAEDVVLTPLEQER